MTNRNQNFLLYRVSFSRITGQDDQGRDELARPKEIGAVWPRKTGGILQLDIIPIELTQRQGVIFLMPVEDHGGLVMSCRPPSGHIEVRWDGCGCLPRQYVPWGWTTRVSKPLVFFKIAYCLRGSRISGNRRQQDSSDFKKSTHASYISTCFGSFNIGRPAASFGCDGHAAIAVSTAHQSTGFSLSLRLSSPLGERVFGKPLKVLENVGGLW